MIRRILLVDDEPHVSRVIKLVLDRKGYEVEMARNGEEALASQRNAPFDVIITDYQMPRMDGRGLCEALAADAPDPAPLTLVVTGKTDPALRDWAGKLNRTEFLEKPLSLKQLTQRLEQHFAGAG